MMENGASAEIGMVGFVGIVRISLLWAARPRPAARWSGVPARPGGCGRPKEPVQRFEREKGGELLHIDIKKLVRFDKIGHRTTGDRTRRARDVA